MEKKNVTVYSSKVNVSPNLQGGSSYSLSELYVWEILVTFFFFFCFETHLTHKKGYYVRGFGILTLVGRGKKSHPKLVLGHSTHLEHEEHYMSQELTFGS